MAQIPRGLGRGQILQYILGDEPRERRFGVLVTIHQNGQPGERSVRHGDRRPRYIPDEERERRRRQWYVSYNNPSGIVQIPQHINLYPVKILITGHSFVSRLQWALGVQAGTNTTWANALHLPNDEYDIAIDGKSGARVTDMKTSLLEKVRRTRPTIIIIDIGTNDVVGPKSSYRIANIAFINAVRWLREVRSVESIVFCHQLYRMDFLGRYKNLTMFNDDIERLNVNLVRFSRRHQKIHHMKHTGLRRPTWTLLEDGYHPVSLTNAWAVGTMKYQKSLRRMCIFARSQMEQ
jgi:lysophospholipase L1-like esterase